MNFKYKLRYGLFPLALLLLLIAAVVLIRGAMRSASINSQFQNAKTLVIDPGHGGIDGGAISVNGAKESDINLSIALKMRDLAAFLGVKTQLTRTEDRSLSQPQVYSEHEDLLIRADIANRANNGVLISIHQNTYPTGQASGAQVIYADGRKSEEWGRLTHTNLVEGLDPTNRRVPMPAKDDFLLLRKTECPALLVECGFMSNISEMEKLQSNTYKTRIAVVLLASFLQYDFDKIYI